MRPGARARVGGVGRPGRPAPDGGDKRQRRRDVGVHASTAPHVAGDLIRPGAESHGSPRSAFRRLTPAGFTECRRFSNEAPNSPKSVQLDVRTRGQRSRSPATSATSSAVGPDLSGPGVSSTHGERGEARLVDEDARALDPELAVADVRVAVAVEPSGVCESLRCSEPSRSSADDLVALVETAARRLARADVVARREQVAGVEADPEARGRRRRPRRAPRAPRTSARACRRCPRCSRGAARSARTRPAPPRRSRRRARSPARRRPVLAPSPGAARRPRRRARRRRAATCGQRRRATSSRISGSSEPQLSR